MILAVNHRHAVHLANEQAQETGRRQNVRKRLILGGLWWTVEEAPEPGLAGLLGRLDRKRRERRALGLGVFHD